MTGRRSATAPIGCRCNGRGEECGECARAVARQGDCGAAVESQVVRGSEKGSGRREPHRLTFIHCCHHDEAVWRDAVVRCVADTSART